MRTRRRMARDVTAPSEARDVVEELADELEVELDADFVKIEVCDAGTGYARRAVRRRPAGEDGGFGLLLVSSVADAWGVTGDGGTCAWALLDRTKPPWRTGVGDIGADRGA